MNVNKQPNVPSVAARSCSAEHAEMTAVAHVAARLLRL